MQQIRYYLKRYPNRIKYALIMIDIIAMIFAIRVYLNYLAIETTIDSTILERQKKMAELAFSQNFLIHYEKSDFATYFLQHENNMLMKWEYIIKFVENNKKSLTGDLSTSPNPSSTSDDANLIRSPKESWQKFLSDKIAK